MSLLPAAKTLIVGELSYLESILVAIDRLANAIRGGDNRETISGACYFAAQDGGPRYLIVIGQVLDWIQPEHCKKAAEFDAAVRQLTATELAAP